MNSTFVSTARRAASLLSISLLAKQLGLLLLVSLLSVVWLQIPDANLFNVGCTVVLGLLILALAGAGETWIALGLARRPVERKLLVKGVLILLATLLVWFGWSRMLEHLQENDSLRAGYLNSRFPHSLRPFFSYSRIVRLLSWFWDTLEWIGTGILIASAFALIATNQPVKSALRTLRSLAFWITLLIGATLIAVGSAIMSWTPGHGLRTEMLSLVLRLTSIVIVNVIVVCYFLAILAVCARQEDYKASDGTPDESQPRTEGIP